MAPRGILIGIETGSRIDVKIDNFISLDIRNPRLNGHRCRDQQKLCLIGPLYGFQNKTRIEMKEERQRRKEEEG